MNKKFLKVNLENELYNFLSKENLENREIIFLCIGTDRSTGDSFGPLTGWRIKKFSKTLNYHVYGTLKYPIHAKNLNKTIAEIYKNFYKPLVIAIDACLGNSSDIGKMIISENPIFPGTAMNKNLPAVGDLSIKGVINTSGFSAFIILQNTRLSIVNDLSKLTASIIISTMKKLRKSYAIQEVASL